MIFSCDLALGCPEYKKSFQIDPISSEGLGIGSLSHNLQKIVLCLNLECGQPFEVLERGLERGKKGKN